MKDSKPPKNLDVIGKLELNPEKTPDILNESKLQSKFFMKPPNWDSIGDAVELLAFQNEREYIGMIQLQKEMRYNAERQGVVNSNRIDELYKLQSTLRKRFIEANHFFKDCDEKKVAAEVKITDEKMLHAELRQIISDFKKNTDILIQFREDLKNTVKEFESYETVIEQVVNESDIWTSRKECVDRCDALMIAQVNIFEQKRQLITEIEDLRLQMVRITNEAALTVLGLNNELSELQRTYDYARSECLKWEKILVNSKDCVSESRLSSCRMFDEIQNLYRRLCHRRGLNPTLKKFETEQKMDFIKDEIEILQEVVKECLKLNKSK